VASSCTLPTTSVWYAYLVILCEIIKIDRSAIPVKAFSVINVMLSRPIYGVYLV